MADIFDAIQFSDMDLRNVIMNNPKAGWLVRAVNEDIRTSDNKSVFTFTTEADGIHMVIPRVRKDPDTGQLKEYSEKEAFEIAWKEQDYIKAESEAEAEFISKGFSKYQTQKETSTYREGE